MKYFLALDKGEKEEENIQKRIIPINIESTDEYDMTTISGINKFTSGFENEDDLKEYLLNNNLINHNDINYRLTIAYKDKQIPKVVSYKNKYDNSVLFKNEHFLLNPRNFCAKLQSLVITNPSFTYEKSTDEEQMCLKLLDIISTEVLTNDYYEHCYAKEQATKIHNYVKNAKYNNYINTNSIFDDIKELVDRIYYDFDSKGNKKKKKDGTLVTSDRKLFEIVIHFVSAKRYLEKSIKLKDLKDKLSLYDQIKEAEAKKHPKPETTQMTLYNIFNLYEEDEIKKTTK